MSREPRWKKWLFWAVSPLYLLMWLVPLLLVIFLKESCQRPGPGEGLFF